jgi:O-antigen biosynthesis protein
MRFWVNYNELTTVIENKPSPLAQTDAGVSQALPLSSPPLTEALEAIRLQIRNGQIRDPQLISVFECIERLVTDLECQRSRVESALDRLEGSQRSMNVHILGIENSLIFSLLRWAGRPLLELKARFQKLLPSAPHRDFRLWLQREELNRLSWTACLDDPKELRWKPKFSVILPIENPGRPWLEQAIKRILEQTYSHWELYVHDNGSDEAWISEYLVKVVEADGRVHYSHSPSHTPAGVFLNSLASLSDGDYVLFLGTNNVIGVDALHRLAEEAENGAEVIYTDEDHIDSEARPIEPIFKPDWSPDLLLSGPYIGQLLAVSRQALQSVGGIRCDFEGAECYDLTLRLMAAGIRPRHIPAILNHRLQTPQSAPISAQQALEDYVRHYEVNASVAAGSAPGFYRVRRQLTEEPLVSLIICSRSPKLLDQCLRSISKVTDYKRLEIIVVEHLGAEDAPMDRVLAKHNAKRIRYEGPFHFSRMNNMAAGGASGSILVFLNDDTEPLVPNWLTELVLHVQRPQIGAAGAKLLYPSGALQHAGIVVGIGDACGHPGRGGHGSPYWKWLDVTRNVSAVTGACLAIRAELFQRLGGFSECFPVNYNDVDLCLRIRAAGLWIVYEPSAVLTHHESQSRPGGVSFGERQRWYSRWSEHMRQGDPFYSPNLTHTTENLSLRFDE